MGVDEFMDMLKGDWEEVGFDFGSKGVDRGNHEGVGGDAMMEQGVWG